MSNTSTRRCQLEVFWVKKVLAYVFNYSNKKLHYEL